MRQVKSEKVESALDATNDAERFTKVYLSMTRRMHQRHKHLLSPLTPAGNEILHNRQATCEAVFVPKPLEDPLRRMLLLLRARLVVPQYAIDQWNKWIKLWLRRWLLTHVTRRRRELHHFGYRPRVNRKPSRRLAMAQPLDLDRIANPSI